MDIRKVRDCAYIILDNAQAIMMEANREKPYPGYILEKLKPIENDLIVLKRQCLSQKEE